MAGEADTVQQAGRSGTVLLEPVRPGRGQRGRLTTVVVAMMAFVGAAILKPWAVPEGQPRPADALSGASHGAVQTSTAPPVAVAAGGDTWIHVPFVPGPEPSIGAALVRSSLKARHDWGVRAIVDLAAPGSPRPATGDLAERWASSMVGGGISPATEGRPVRALGVTLAPGTIAIEVRVLQEVRGRERWLDVQPVAGANPGASPLFWPPRRAGGWEAAWSPGLYRFVILTASGVVELAAYLPGASQAGALPDGEAELWHRSVRPGGWLGLDTRLGEGALAGVIAAQPRLGPEGPLPVVVSLGGRPAPWLDPAAAWLSAPGRGPGPVAGVGYLPRAVAIGAAAPPGLRIRSARLTRYLPAGPVGEPVALSTSAIITTIDHVPKQYVAHFEAPNGLAWPAGVYAIELDAAGAAGPIRQTYAITLLPGSARVASAALSAARGWARFAGAWGVAAGHLEQLDGPARLAIRHAAQSPEPAVSGAADFTRRCLEVNLVDAARPILGISHPAGAGLEAIGLQRVFRDGTVAWPAPAVARSIVPGLSLVAAAEGTSWLPGWYRLIITAGGRTSALPVCVGEVSGSTLLVPPGAGDRASAAILPNPRSLP